MISTPLKERVTILVVDDDEDDRVFIVRALKRALSNEIQTLNDGQELLDFLRSRPSCAPAELPSCYLILLDLNMPFKSGHEALQEIRQDPVLRRLPVIVLTTSHEQEEVDRAYHAGANAYMTKPVSFDVLVKAMRALQDFWFDVVGETLG
jgi:CheY-like chemotaxis protein